jgi:hypothetical protein
MTPKKEQASRNANGTPSAESIARLTAFYTEHNPEKLPTVIDTLKKYPGREDELFAHLQEKYAAGEAAGASSNDTPSKESSPAPATRPSYEYDSPARRASGFAFGGEPSASTFVFGQSSPAPAAATAAAGSSTHSSSKGVVPDDDDADDVDAHGAESDTPAAVDNSDGAVDSTSSTDGGLTAEAEQTVTEEAVTTDASDAGTTATDTAVSAAPESAAGTDASAEDETAVVTDTSSSSDAAAAPDATSATEAPKPAAVSGQAGALKALIARSTEDMQQQHQQEQQQEQQQSQQSTAAGTVTTGVRGGKERDLSSALQHEAILHTKDADTPDFRSVLLQPSTSSNTAVMLHACFADAFTAHERCSILYIVGRPQLCAALAANVSALSNSFAMDGSMCNATIDLSLRTLHSATASITTCYCAVAHLQLECLLLILNTAAITTATTIHVHAGG